jgi:hypothetical protein
MTFEELDAEFPNGFDDAEITSLTLDYQSRTATLQLNLRLNLPDGPDSQEYRRGVLIVRGFYYVSIEPPDIQHLFYPSDFKITVDGFLRIRRHSHCSSTSNLRYLQGRSAVAFSCMTGTRLSESLPKMLSSLLPKCRSKEAFHIYRPCGFKFSVTRLHRSCN